MMAATPALWIVVGLVLAGTGTYMWSAPRRLFTRADDPSEYRPQATELDSERGRFMTRTYPPILILAGLALIAFQIISLLSE